MSGSVGKNPERVQAGLKAATHNPNVSEEAKQSAAQRLEEMGTTVDAKHSTGSNYSKTTAQRRAEFEGEELEDDVDEEFDEEEYTGESQPRTKTTKSGRGTKNEGNVVGGYKATLKNPRVSEEAKHHAEQVLKEKDAI